MGHFFFFYDLHQDLESVTVISEAAPAGATSGEPAEIETAHVETSGACSVGEQAEVKTAHVEASGAATISEPEEEPAHIERAITVSEPAEVKTVSEPAEVKAATISKPAEVKTASEPAEVTACGSETPTSHFYADGDLMGQNDAPSRPPPPKGCEYDSDGDLMGDSDAPVQSTSMFDSSSNSSSSSDSSSDSSS